MAGVFILISSLVVIAQVISTDIQETLVILENWAWTLGETAEEAAGG